MPLRVHWDASAEAADASSLLWLKTYFGATVDGLWKQACHSFCHWERRNITKYRTKKRTKKKKNTSEFNSRPSWGPPQRWLASAAKDFYNEGLHSKDCAERDLRVTIKHLLNTRWHWTLISKSTVCTADYDLSIVFQQHSYNHWETVKQFSRTRSVSS